MSSNEQNAPTPAADGMRTVGNRFESTGLGDSGRTR